MKDLPEWLLAAMHKASKAKRKTPVMLAQSYSAKKHAVYPMVAEDKLDGFRCFFVNGKGYTRLGKSYASFDPFAKTLHSIVGDDVCVDAELMAKNWNDTSKLLKRIHGLKPEKIKQEVVCWVFDVFDRKSLGKATYQKRRKEVKRIVKEAQSLETGYTFSWPHAIVLERPEDVSKALEFALKQGLEGIIVKPLDGIYELKRSHSWGKLKPFTDITVTIVGLRKQTGLCPECSTAKAKGQKEGCKVCNGEGKVVKEGRLGAWICRTESGDKIRVGGGFTEKQRILYWKRGKKMFGKKIDVKIQKESGGNDIVARHPVFMRERPDL